MTSDHDSDASLRRDFQALRASDARQTPDFAGMIARARAQAAIAAPVRPRRPRWRSARLFLVGAPLAAAAALAIWLRPSRTADREFEQAVSEWSRTAARSASSPTDGLLSVPGTEFLRGTPVVGIGGPNSRRGS